MGGPGGRPDYVGLVFVYGSLKRGERFHHQLDGATFEGTAELQGLELYDLGPFPMAIPNAQAAAVAARAERPRNLRRSIMAGL